MNSFSKILLIGGSGTLGKTMARLLQDSGYDLRIMTRYPEKINLIQHPGIEIVKGDLINPKSLASACEGIDVVIAMAHSILGTGKYGSSKVDVDGYKSLIDLAKDSNVKCLIYISGIANNHESALDFWRHKIEVEQYLQKSGLDYIIIRPSAFMETHIHELMGKGILKNGKALIMGQGKNTINFVSVVDVAQIVHQALENRNALNTIIEIGGPDNISKNDIVKIYEQYTGKKVKITHLSPGLLKKISWLFKPFHQGISRILKFSAAIDELDMDFDPSNTYEKYPIKPVTVAHFIQEKCTQA